MADLGKSRVRIIDERNKPSGFDEQMVEIKNSWKDKIAKHGLKCLRWNYPKILEVLALIEYM